MNKYQKNQFTNKTNQSLFYSYLTIVTIILFSIITNCQEATSFEIVTDKVNNIFNDNSVNPVQIITLSSEYSRVSVFNKVNIEAIYSTSDHKKNYGVGLRFHYDSSKLEFIQFLNVLQDPIPLVLDPTPQYDSVNADNDSKTDKYVFIAWGGTN